MNKEPPKSKAQQPKDADPGTSPKSQQSQRPPSCTKHLKATRSTAKRRSAAKAQSQRDLRYRKSSGWMFNRP